MTTIDQTPCDAPRGGLKPVALIVDDEASIRLIVRKVLVQEGWVVHEADTVRQGLIQAGTRRPDMIILDLRLPDGEGITYIKDLRAWSDVPILVLTAHDYEDEKIAVLDAGADDYLVKPFGVGELAARVRAARRRSLAVTTAAARSPNFAFGDVAVDLIARRVTRAGIEVHLTPVEYRLLMTMTSHAGKVMTHAQLLTSVWGPRHTNDRQYIRVYMTSLRKKLEHDPAQPRHLLTESAVGYRLAL